MSRVYSQLNNFNQCSDDDDNEDEDETRMVLKRMKAIVMVMVHWDCNA